MSTEKPRRLGRGLEALIAARPNAVDRARDRTDDSPLSGLRQLPVGQIRPNRLQPRKEFSPASLADLQTSIRANGLLQPITVRMAEGGYELIAGERRFRAMQQLGWSEIPAIVREPHDVDDQAALTLALVENLQRADLNPIEEADGYQQLITQFSLTQQQVADAVGKDRSTIANTLRLLALPAVVRRMVREGELTIGHARALLSLGDDHRMIELAKAIVGEGLNVREVEQRVRDAGGRQTARPAGSEKSEKSRGPEVARIEDELRRRLQTDVRIKLTGKDRGELRVAFYSADDLERVLDVVLGVTREAL